MKLYFKNRDAARKYARMVQRKKAIKKLDAPFNGVFSWAVVIY